MAFRILKLGLVGVLGRERANRLSGPFYDWCARRRTQAVLEALPQRGLRVNLGCGPRTLKGWVNVDAARAPAVDVVWDVRKGLPFRDESCTAIFCEHMIEHLSRVDAARLLVESRRVLEPGGVIRVSTPDAAIYLRAYVGDQSFFARPEFLCPADTPMDRINLMMREQGQHLWCYDYETLERLIREAGFARCYRQDFGASVCSDLRDIDQACRAFESLYVEAVK